MQPITMMRYAHAPYTTAPVSTLAGAGSESVGQCRNALGRDEGGSGVPLDKEQYEASVAFWQNRAPIVTGNPNGE